MTPAKELSGFIVEILPHEKYKPHLNDDEKVNARLEKKKHFDFLDYIGRNIVSSGYFTISVLFL